MVSASHAWSASVRVVQRARRPEARRAPPRRGAAPRCTRPRARTHRRCRRRSPRRPPSVGVNGAVRRRRPRRPARREATRPQARRFCARPRGVVRGLSLGELGRNIGVPARAAAASPAPLTSSPSSAAPPPPPAPSTGARWSRRRRKLGLARTRRAQTRRASWRAGGCRARRTILHSSWRRPAHSAPQRRGLRVAVNARRSRCRQPSRSRRRSVVRVVRVVRETKTIRRAEGRVFFSLSFQGRRNARSTGGTKKKSRLLFACRKIERRAAWRLIDVCDPKFRADLRKRPIGACRAGETRAAAAATGSRLARGRSPRARE